MGWINIFIIIFNLNYMPKSTSTTIDTHFPSYIISTQSWMVVFTGVCCFAISGSCVGFTKSWVFKPAPASLVTCAITPISTNSYFTFIFSCFSVFMAVLFLWHMFFYGEQISYSWLGLSIATNSARLRNASRWAKRGKVLSRVRIASPPPPRRPARQYTQI